MLILLGSILKHKTNASWTLGRCENHIFYPRITLPWEFGVWCIKGRHFFLIRENFENPSGFLKVYDVGTQNKRIWITIVMRNQIKDPSWSYIKKWSENWWNLQISRNNLFSEVYGQFFQTGPSKSNSDHQPLTYPWKLSR